GSRRRGTVRPAAADRPAARPARRRRAAAATGSRWSRRARKGRMLSCPRRYGRARVHTSARGRHPMSTSDDVDRGWCRLLPTVPPVGFPYSRGMLSPRPTRTDVLLAVGVLAVLVGSAFASRSGPDRPVDALGLSMLAAIAVATLVRRRWPVVVLALCTALIFDYYVTGFPPVGLELPLAAPVATVAAAGRWRLAVLWSVAVTAFAYGSRI